ncbi:MAG: serine aminopeptidase domain-containing protein [Anaerolineales bacterium]
MSRLDWRILGTVVRLGSALAVLTMVLGLLYQPIPAMAARPVSGSQPEQPALACADGTQASGALYRYCLPTPFSWNGDLVVYAHGYVTPTATLSIPAEFTTTATLLSFYNYALAATSYSTNGLAVREGVDDVLDLVEIFRAANPTLNRVYVAGPSEGGLIATLALEQHPEVFSAGLALCGPIGDFRRQIDYFGDFRVVFDYFFPGLMPGSPISVPVSLMNNWNTHYSTVIEPAITDPANTLSVTQLLSVTQAAYVPTDTTTITNTISSVLWYNVFATNDAIAKLGGQPFDNMGRVYTGSLNDTQLNATVQHFSADPAALDEIEAYYQTAGRPSTPLVTMHTTLDPVVPYWHEDLYRAKVVAHGRTPRHDNVAVDRYGHCNFQVGELQSALILLQQRVLNPPPYLLFLPGLLR